MSDPSPERVDRRDQVDRAGEGVLFVATGPAYIEQAAASANASRPRLGGRPIAIVVDDPGLAERTGAFDRVIPHTEARRDFRDKIPPLCDPPFERTLFLDSDARVIAPTPELVDDLYRLLEHHDLAAAHAPVRRPPSWWDDAVPAHWPEFNTGVLLFTRRGAETAMRHWRRRFDEAFERHGETWDQATFRSAAWQAAGEGVPIAVLPPEANLRTTKPWVAGKGLAVSILHGRVPDAERDALIAFLNDDIDRFRTNAEWLERHPHSSIRPRVRRPRRRGFEGWLRRIFGG